MREQPTSWFAGTYDDQCREDAEDEDRDFWPTIWSMPVKERAAIAAAVSFTIERLMKERPARP